MQKKDPTHRVGPVEAFSHAMLGGKARRAGLDRWREGLGLERNILVMLVTIVAVEMGEGLWTRFLPKYLELLGASTWIVAVYGALRDLLDAVYQYPGGWLSDRLGRRAGLVLFTLLAIVGYGLYLFSRSWGWILIGTFFVMGWGSLSSPAIFAIIGDSLSSSRRAIGFGVQSAVKRIPAVLGPLIGGGLITSLGVASGVKWCFGINIVLALIAVAVVWNHYIEKAASGRDTLRITDLWRGMDTRLKRLLLADILARWAEGIPKVFIVLYVINILHVHAFRFGWLSSLQMLAAILIYIPVAKLSDRMNRRPFVLLTFAFFALFPLALVRSTNLFWLVIAFIIAGLRETGEPARKALIVDLAQETARGRAVGIYYLIRNLVVFPASLVGGWLWTKNVQWPFYSAFLVGVVGFLVYAAWGPDEDPSRAASNQGGAS